MACKLIIKEEAVVDTVEAYLYYEGKTTGLGEKFLKSLQARYDQISHNPGHYSFIDKRKKLRDVKIKRFPYVVIYDFNGNEVTVYSVHNSHKKPKQFSVVAQFENLIVSKV